MPTRRTAFAAAVLSLVVIAAACSSDSGDDDGGTNRIGRIDGPATVNDDAGADQDGAPVMPPGVPDAIPVGS